MDSLISPADHWLIWTFLVGWATISLILEQKYKIAKKITGAVIALVGGMIASSTGLMPTESESYDVVWTYLIPIIIPLLLMKMNIFTIFRETGRLMGAFHLAAIGTVIGTIVAYFLMNSVIDNLNLIAPAMSASYVGGGVNFVAMVAVFNPPNDLVNATVVADSLIMVIYFLVLMLLPAIKLFRKFFPYTDKTHEICVGSQAQPDDDYWKPKAIGLLDIGKSLSIAFVIATLSAKVSDFFSQESMPELVTIILGQKYLLLTTFSFIFPLVFPKTAKSLVGNEEIATFLVFIFFVTLGVPASIKQVIFGAPLMLLFCAIILFFNFLCVISLGKLFKYELEELILAGVLTAGGPMNGVAIAISKQWNKLIIPSMMVGVWGYIIGNYIGYLIGIFLKT